MTLNRAAASVGSVDAGVTVQQLSPKIILAVNVNGAHGKSFQASLIYSNSILPTLSNRDTAGRRVAAIDEHIVIHGVVERRHRDQWRRGHTLNGVAAKQLGVYRDEQ